MVREEGEALPVVRVHESPSVISPPVSPTEVSSGAVPPGVLPPGSDPQPGSGAALARDRADFSTDLLNLWAIGADIDRADTAVDGAHPFPVTTVDGVVVASGRYPTRAQLLRFLRLDAHGNPRRILNLQETDAASSAAAREPEVGELRATGAVTSGGATGSLAAPTGFSTTTRASAAVDQETGLSLGSGIRKTRSKGISNGAAPSAAPSAAPRADSTVPSGASESPASGASAPSDASSGPAPAALGSVERREPQLISLVAAGSSGGACACGAGGAGGCCSA